MTTKKRPSRRQVLRAWERRHIADDATPEQRAQIMDLQAQLRAHEILDRAQEFLHPQAEHDRREETAARLGRDAEAVQAAVRELIDRHADGEEVTFH